MSNIIVPNAAMDKPDTRDFSYADIRVGGIESTLPEECLPDYIAPVLNQGATMRCTLFSPAGAVMAMNAHESSIVGVPEYKKTTGVELLEQAIAEGFSETNGWYIQSGVKLYHKNKFFRGYASVFGKQQIKQAIVDKKKVCTGSNSIDWSQTNDIAVIKADSPGHAFFIDGYNKIGVIIKNSWGDMNNNKGYFIVKWEDISALFTCYALLDESDAPMLYAQYAKMKGWCNLEDFRPNDVCTRSFCASLISKATGVCLNDIFDVAERRSESPAIALAFQTMFGKTGKKIKVTKRGVLKRWEVVELIKTYIK